MKMKPASAILSLLAISLSALAVPLNGTEGQAVSVSYDERFDSGTSSLTTVACSNGVYGLITQGYSDFKSIPGFPMIGGSPTIAGWDSPNCGKCYRIHYQAGDIDRAIYVTAVDVASGGFNLALQAMNKLTDGMAIELGRIEATYTETDPMNCTPAGA